MDKHPEITKMEIIELIEKLDDADSKTLSEIESHLRRPEIDSQMKDLREGELAALDKKSWDFLETTINSKRFGYRELTDYIGMLHEPNTKITPDVFQTPHAGTLFNLVPPKLRENTVFKETIGPIMTYSSATANGYGAGELFFLIYGNNATKAHSQEGADVNLDGWKLEIKSTNSGLKSSASTEKAGQGAESRVIDSLNAEFVKQIKDSGWSISGTYKTPSLDGGWFPSYWKTHGYEYGEEPTIQKMSQYISTIYKVNTDDTYDMAKRVYNDLGTPNANRAWSSSVVSLNKTGAGWDSVVVINTKNQYTLEYANFISGEDIPDIVRMRPTLGRGKSTFAYPDGWISLDLTGVISGERHEELRAKNEECINILNEILEQVNAPTKHPRDRALLNKGILICDLLSTYYDKLEDPLYYNPRLINGTDKIYGMVQAYQALCPS